MPSTRDLRLRIKSVKNLAQVTKALETVSASRVRRAIQKVEATRPYAEKAWKVLVHLARQPGHSSLHPLLAEPPEVRKVLVMMVAGDRGLAGAHNVNVLRHTLHEFDRFDVPVEYVAVGRRARDMLLRRKKPLVAQFVQLPEPPSFMDVSAIGRLLVDDFLSGGYDQVYMVYTEYINMVRQEPKTQQLLPFSVADHVDQQPGEEANHRTQGVFAYEPGQEELLNEVVPRFTAMQVYKAILSAQASEHAARMVAMRNATENAAELTKLLELEYNKVRQAMITNDMLDIAGGAEALAQSEKKL